MPDDVRDWQLESGYNEAIVFNNNLIEIIMAELDKDFQFFLDNKSELVKKYPNEYVVIVNRRVVGFFRSENEAYHDSVAKYGLGNFIVQLCATNDADHVQTYHSRVSFV